MFVMNVLARDVYRDGAFIISHLYELFADGTMWILWFGRHLEFTLLTRDLLLKAQCQHNIVPSKAV